jgi:hypothetical protein
MSNPILSGMMEALSSQLSGYQQNVLRRPELKADG